MDWKVFLTTFTAIFFAEMADKTQFVGMGLSAKSGKPLSVWLGSISAYILITAVAVLLGAVLGKYIKPSYIQYGGGICFVVIGLLMIWGKI